MDLWKDIKTGPSVPKVIYAVIEIPKGSRNKYKYDKDKKTFTLDKVLYLPFHYPAEYGMIPQTVLDDGDPMDILVIMDQPTFPGCIIECRPIGVMKMVDEGERDDKILGVPVKDHRFKSVEDIQDVPVAFLEEIEHFFCEYKKLEEKTTKVVGWKDAKKAFDAIEHSIKLYNEMSSIKSLFLLK